MNDVMKVKMLGGPMDGAEYTTPVTALAVMVALDPMPADFTFDGAPPLGSARVTAVPIRRARREDGTIQYLAVWAERAGR